MNWHPAWDGQKTIIAKKERRLILQYHLSSAGLGNFSSGNVIDSEAGFAFPFLHSITIIRSVILGLFIYQATITKTLRTRCLNATVQSIAVQALVCRGIADSHTPDCPCVSVFRSNNIPPLLIAKMAHVLHLASGSVRESSRNSRKLHGKVLQCFKNLSSHSTELSQMNNRFGTWPACTGESVTAALWSGFPSFDGCAVSHNSWRRRAPAERLRWRGQKTTNRKQNKRFLCEADRRIWALPERDVSPCSVACGALHQDTQILVPHGPPINPKRGPGRRGSAWNATPASPKLTEYTWGNFSFHPKMIVLVFGEFVAGKTDPHRISRALP